MSAQYLITTRAKDSICPRCRGAVLCCHVEGMPTAVDADPIPAESEYLELLEGRRTYSRRMNGFLMERTAWLIRNDILGAQSPIHAEHVCQPQGQLMFDLEMS